MKSTILCLLFIFNLNLIFAQTWIPHWQGADYNQLLYWHEGTDEAYAGFEHVFYAITEGGNNYEVISTDATLRYQAMDFTSTSNGWALKKNDQFEMFAAHTIDGGITWTTEGQIPEFGSNPVIEVWNDNLILVGNGNKVFRSIDQGQTWNQVANLPNGIVGIFFYDQNNVWISGNQGVVLKSVDGGAMWNTVNAGISSTYPADDIRFLSANEVLISVSGGGGIIRKTIDGGTNWTDVNPGVFFITAFEILDASHMLVASQNEIRETMDGGSNWNTLYTWTYNRVQGHFWQGANDNLVLTGMGGQVFQQNTDNSWTEINAGSAGFVSMDFFNDNEGWAVGYSTTTNRLFHTIDGGTTWHMINAPESCTDVDFVDSNVGFAQAFGGIYRTADGGVNWELKSATIGGAMEVVDGLNVHILQNNNAVWNTFDGGDNWQLGQYDVPLPFAAFPLYDIEFTSVTHGVLSGDTGGNSTGTVYFTNDGGLNWIKNLTFPVSNDLPECAYVSSSIGFHSTLGTLYKTVNGGATWTTLNVGPSSYYLSNLYFSDANNGWAVKYLDNKYYLMQSTNGGSTWNDVSSFWMGQYILNDFYIPTLPNGKIASPDAGFIRWDQSLCPLPEFTASLQQEVVTVCLGNNAFISFDASTDIESVTWYRNDQIVSTNETLVILDTELSDSGEYTCVLTKTNGCGTFELTLLAQLNVVTEVVPVTTIESNVLAACEGGLLEFTSSVEGGSAFSYLWYQDGNVVGFSETLTFANAQPEMSGTYYVFAIVQTACGTVNTESNEIAVAIDNNFSLNLQPLNPEEYICEGQSIDIVSQAFSQIDLTYEWILNDEVVSNSDVLSIVDANPEQGGIYTLRVTASNGCGVLIEESEVTIFIAPLAEISQPTTNQVISTCNGSSIVLICDANPLTENMGIEYNWYQNGTYVFYGQELELSNIGMANAGEYTCDVVYYNECGDATESFLMYTLILGATGPIVNPTESEVELLVCAGSDLNLVFEADIEIESYTWFLNENILGTAQELVLTDINAMMQGDYYCEVVATNECGTTDTTILMYSLNLSDEDFDAPDVISESICEGSDYELVFESNSEITGWQWYLDGVLIASSATVLLANFSASDMGTYECEVLWNTGCDEITSTFMAYLLEIDLLPVIADPLLLGTVSQCPGATFSAAYFPSDGADTFTWYHNGEVVGTSVVLSIPNLGVDDSGIYSCTASGTNFCGTTSETHDIVDLLVEEVAPEIVESSGELSTTLTYLAYTWELNGNEVGDDATYVPEVSGNYTVTVINDIGCEGTSDVFVFVGMEELEAFQVTCSPNPFIHELTIQSTSKILEIEIYNSMGQLVLRSNDVKLNLGSLAKGVYTLRCKSLVGTSALRIEKL